MYITVKLLLYPTMQQIAILEQYSKTFHSEIEKIMNHFQEQHAITFYPYRQISNAIAFHSKQQAIHFAETFYTLRANNQPATYKPLFSALPKSFHLEQKQLTILFGNLFQPKQIELPTSATPYQEALIFHQDIVKMDIRKQKEGILAYIIINKQAKVKQPMKRKMGVDLGMKCPAVCYTCEGHVKFIGNGREIRYHIRRISSHFNKLDKTNSHQLLKFNHKLQNYKSYIDHCISKQVIAYAKQQHIDTICLENLTNLQHKFHYHNQMIWSYERMQKLISYKAQAEGINICFVDPHLTSKRCPHCGKINRVKDRAYVCKCGFHKHRDIVGAMNILRVAEV